MPKQTFFNLPDEKKHTLIQAAQKEFSRVSLYEASIANIVKAAEIPRGSFYQYFENKEDLYFYLLNDHAQKSQKKLYQCFKNNNGCLFKAMNEMFHSLLIELDSDELQKFYRNIFLNFDYKTEKAFMSSVNFGDFNKQYEDLKHLIDLTNLNVENEDELIEVVQMVVTIMMQNFVLKFAKELSDDELIRKHEVQMRLLKKGFYKGEK